VSGKANSVPDEPLLGFFRRRTSVRIRASSSGLPSRPIPYQSGGWFRFMQVCKKKTPIAGNGRNSLSCQRLRRSSAVRRYAFYAGLA
jgi:hypothetical protein